MIQEIRGKIRARFEDSKEIPGAVNVIPIRVEPLGYIVRLQVYVTDNIGVV